MAFPSTLPLYLRFYEHGHAVTFIRQRLMSRLNDSLGCEILFDNPAIIFPPLFFSFSLPSSKNRVFQIRIGNGETDKRNVEPYLAALFFFFFLNLPFRLFPQRRKLSLSTRKNSATLGIDLEIFF